MPSNNNTKKPSNTGTSSADGDNKEEMVRGNSAVSSLDVKVRIAAPSAAAPSFVTQVDRNGQPMRHAPPPPPETNQNNGNQTNGQTNTNAANSSGTQPVRPRTFFERLFCCGPKQPLLSSSNNNNTPPTGGSISLVVANSSAKSTASSSYRKNSQNSTSLRSLPARLPEMEQSSKKNRGKKCLALDLDETLVHSSFQPVENASFTIAVVIEGIVHNVYVMKRPGCDEFLSRLADHYELLIYTASLSKYADPLLDILDPDNLVSKRLFREHCVFYDGHYVKDLSLLNRDISQTIIVDNSPMSYIFHPENAIDCSSFFDDPTDVELWQIADFLISIKNSEDVRPFCRHWREWCRNNPSSVPTFGTNMTTSSSNSMVSVNNHHNHNRGRHL